MPFLEELGIHVAGSAAMAIAGPALTIAGGLLGGGTGRSALIGAGIGAIAGMANSNSYSSTDTLGNALIGGALGGLGGGLSKFLLPRTPGLLGSGAKALFQYRNSIARGSAGLAKNTGKSVFNAASFALRHPVLTGGVLAGGYMGLASDNPKMMDIDFSGAEEVNHRSWRSFQDSSSGLTLGLHAKRHR